MAICYTNEAESITPKQIKGFFANWPKHPDPETHLAILRNSYKVWLAFDKDRCVGFINAISDRVFYAYIPLLEVLENYRGHGIGSELLYRMEGSLRDMYAIDIVCDESVAPFYASKKFSRCVGVIKRNYHNQNGLNARG
jgi:ribosomal protein S18 acetylase RimI-like enzyme